MSVGNDHSQVQLIWWLVAILYCSNFDTSTRSTAHIAMLDLGSQEVTQAEADEIALLTVGVYKEYYPSGLQRYQGTVALKDFSLAIKKRECFSLLGSNGAGKSTMMNILLKQVEATRGKVYVFGQELFQIDEATHCSLSYCPQTNALFDTLTTMECLEFYCRIRGIGESEIEVDILNSHQPPPPPSALSTIAPPL